jgi:hypothetical protein
MEIAHKEYTNGQLIAEHTTSGPENRPENRHARSKEIQSRKELISSN